jgi:hypothetical protein
LALHGIARQTRHGNQTTVRYAKTGIEATRETKAPEKSALGGSPGVGSEGERSGKIGGMCCPKSSRCCC